MTTVKEFTGNVTHYVISFNYSSVSNAALDEITNLAYYDLPIGLPNRRLLIERLNQPVISSSRTSQMGTLLLIDLDSFKTLNDSLGHEVEDELLKEAANRIGSCVRQGDTVARFGGDELWYC